MPGKKVIVSEFGYAHWLAQTYKIDLAEFNYTNPDNVDPETYSKLKQLLPSFLVNKDEPPRVMEMRLVQ